MSLSIETARRLAYIRYLHQLGVDQARLPEPLSSISILMLHDAVESHLVLAAEHLNVSLPHEFEKYWKALGPKVPGGSLASMQAMRRLNKVRVNLKHYGSQPSADTIAQAVADTAAYMAANTQLIFGVDYDTVSMVQMISQDAPRSLADSAEMAISAGNHIEAMMRLRQALDALFADHEPGVGFQFEGSSPFSFGPSLGGFRLKRREIERLLKQGDSSRTMDAQRLADHISATMEIAEEVQSGMRYTALGIDYPSYVRFEKLTPYYADTFDDIRHWRAHVGYAPTSDDYAFCLQFLVTASLRLAAADAHAADPSWVVHDHWGNARWEDLTTEPIDRGGVIEQTRPEQ